MFAAFVTKKIARLAGKYWQRERGVSKFCATMFRQTKEPGSDSDTYYRVLLAQIVDIGFTSHVDFALSPQYGISQETT